MPYIGTFQDKPLGDYTSEISMSSLFIGSLPVRQRTMATELERVVLEMELIDTEQQK